MCGTILNFINFHVLESIFPFFFFGLEHSSLPVELLISGSDVSVDVVEIVCSLVKNLSPSVNGAVMVSMGVNILTKMLIW